MRLLNDRQLNWLLRQAKMDQPKPDAGFAARVMQAYRMRSCRQGIWPRLFSCAVRIPLPAVVLASVVLVFMGMMLGRRLAERPLTKLPAVQERSQDRPVLNLCGLQPVSELRPKILKRIYESK